ncbi:MAG: hypothetical protein PVJ33_18000 [Lysobacterales bacterium]
MNEIVFRPWLTALAMALGLYVLMIAFLMLPGGLVLLLASAAFFVWSGWQYGRGYSLRGPNKAFSRVGLDLFLLIVVLPNLSMGLLIYADGVLGNGILAPLGDLLAMLVWLLASPYYLIPSAVFGSAMFQTETLIAPVGAAGLLFSALLWTMFALLAMLFLHAVTRRRAEGY